jgi:hypothetical protein
MSWPINTVLKLAALSLMPDETIAINVFWALLDDNAGGGPLADADILQAAANYVDNFYDEMGVDLADTLLGTIVEVWAVDEPSGDLTPIGDETTTYEGQSVNDALPNGVAGVMSLKTVETDVTGRKFVPGYTDETFVDNNMTGPALARAALAAVEWAAQWVDANDVILNPGVYSSVKQNFFIATGTVIVNAIAGYQRRRKPGVGT